MNKRLSQSSRSLATSESLNTAIVVIIYMIVKSQVNRGGIEKSGTHPYFSATHFSMSALEIVVLIVTLFSDI